MNRKKILLIILSSFIIFAIFSNLFSNEVLAQKKKRKAKKPTKIQKTTSPPVSSTKLLEEEIKLLKETLESNYKEMQTQKRNLSEKDKEIKQIQEEREAKCLTALDLMSSENWRSLKGRASDTNANLFEIALENVESNIKKAKALHKISVGEIMDVVFKSKGLVPDKEFLVPLIAIIKEKIIECRNRLKETFIGISNSPESVGDTKKFKRYCEQIDTPQPSKDELFQLLFKIYPYLKRKHFDECYEEALNYQLDEFNRVRYWII